LIDPLKFYKEKILGVREQAFFDNDLSLMESGTIAHDTLEELYTPYIGKRMRSEYYKDLEVQIAPALLKHYRKVFGGDKKIFGKNLLMLNALEESILKLLSKEKEKIQKGDSLTILYLEKEFEYSLNVPEVGKILLKGKIDRIDRFNGVFRIVDYKLGKIESSKLKISDWESLKGDIKRLALFQILLYTYVNKEVLTDEVSIQAGIISFKSMDQYLLPFAYIKENKSKISNEINTEVLNSFENFLVKLAQEIFDTSKPFAALEN
jgi:ATP-dependent helicase/DNAse subunit B